MKTRSAMSICAALTFGAACAYAQVEHHPSMGEMSFLWENYKRASLLIDHIGYTNHYFRCLARDSRGERLFLGFESRDHASNLTAIVSSHGLQVKDLFGPAYNDGQKPYWWDSSQKAWQFADGRVLPSDRYYIWGTANDLVIVEDKPARTEWIARANTPLVPLIALATNVWGEIRLFPRGDSIDVFKFEGMPGGGPSGQAGALIFESFCKVTDKPQLRRSMSFPWARLAYDVHPNGKCAVLRQDAVYLAHGILVDLHSGQESKLGFASDYGLFLKNDLIRAVLQLEKGQVQHDPSRK